MSDPVIRPPADPAGSPPASPPARPRWVTLLGVGLLILVVAVVLTLALVGGEHGPGRHQ